MQALGRLGLVVLFVLPAARSTAGPTQADFAGIQKQLQQCDRELRSVAKSMQSHARTTMPKALDKAQDAGLAVQRRELEATAAAALALAREVEQRESKARARTLTRADFESLGDSLQPVTARIAQAPPGTSAPTKQNRGSLGASIKDLEAAQESVRNQRQMDTTAFQNFDQRANQLYQMLSSVIKTLNEMARIGANRTGL